MSVSSDGSVSMDKQIFADAARGCLVGGAVGDALGVPVEFLATEEIFKHYGAAGIQEFDLDAATGKALISDDTQMTLFTANGLLFGYTRALYRGISAAPSVYIRDAYLDWLHTQVPDFTNTPLPSWLLEVPELHAWRAPGRTCLTALANGAHGSLDNVINNSKGCGGVMRVAPLGIFNEDPAQAAQNAAEAAAITHTHPLGFISAAVLAFLVSTFTHRDNPQVTKDDFKEALLACYTMLKEKFSEFKEDVEAQIALLKQAIDLAESGEKDLDAVLSLGEGWVGEETIAIAVYCACRHLDDFDAAVRAAVNHGGDSDSTGAVTGNLIGSIVGFNRIDTRWIKNLELADVILEMADDLVTSRYNGFSEWNVEPSEAELRWQNKYIKGKRL